VKRSRRTTRKRARGITIRELKAMSRAIVFARDGHRCVVCNRGKKDGVQLQWSHIVSQKVAATRFLTENIVCHCAGHHFAWHTNPPLWVLWWVERYPERHAKVQYAVHNLKPRTKAEWKAYLESQMS